MDYFSVEEFILPNKKHQDGSEQELKQYAIDLPAKCQQNFIRYSLWNICDEYKLPESTECHYL
jgi:hypothetical protein